MVEVVLVKAYTYGTAFTVCCTGLSSALYRRLAAEAEEVLRGRSHNRAVKHGILQQTDMLQLCVTSPEVIGLFVGCTCQQGVEASAAGVAPGAAHAKHSLNP